MMLQMIAAFIQPPLNNLNDKSTVKQWHYSQVGVVLSLISDVKSNFMIDYCRGMDTDALKSSILLQY